MQRCRSLEFIREWLYFISVKHGAESFPEQATYTGGMTATYSKQFSDFEAALSY